jgi:DNA-binding beta-propeller fold protein YncE
MRRTLGLATILLCLLMVGSSVGALDAAAYREPRVHEEGGAEEWLELDHLPILLTEGQIEGACGVAVQPGPHSLFVSDYYHRAVHTYTTSGIYQNTIALAGGNPPPVLEPINELNAVCGLAVDDAGNLFGEELHGRVMRLPSEAVIDEGQSTGIAVGEGGDLYVDDRTYVAVYDAPVLPGEAPVSKIGVGNLVNAYGVAVDAKAGRVYVPDAASGTVKVFEPSVSLTTPVDTLASPPDGFRSLVGAALAVDESPTAGEGHVLVVDDLQPGLPFPEAAIYEFGADGAYLDRLQVRSVGPIGVKHTGPIFGEPSGIAVDQASGDLYVTTGNSEDANVVAYGPFQAEAPPAPLVAGGSAGAMPRANAVAESPPASASGGASASVVEQRRGVRVSFNGKLTPHVLPRHGTAPVGIVVDANIGATGGDDPPQLRRISIAINRNGHFNSKGLPACGVEQIQPSTTDGALAACRPSLVGEGHFSANVKLPEQSPFPSSGKVLAFNGKVNGRPAILAHIYGTEPAPTSTVLPFLLRKSRGTYGTTLEASLPQATGSWGYVTGLRISLRRSFSYRGHSRSFLSAGCPAPAGFPSAAFPLAKTSFAFAGNLTLEAVLTRTCKARG